MAWTAPRTWAAAELVTAAIMNTHIRDNQLALIDGVAVFIPPCWGISQGVEEMNIVNNRPIVRLADVADVGLVAFRTPNSFTTIVKSVLVIRPRVTQANANLDIESDYAGIGQLSQVHNEADNITTYNIVNDTLFEIDCSGILTVLAAEDYVGIKLTLQDNAHDVDLMGFYFEWT